jgi:hypothetical protein
MATRKRNSKQAERHMLLLYEEQSADEAPPPNSSRRSVYTTAVSRQKLERKTGPEANILLEVECFFALATIYFALESEPQRDMEYSLLCTIGHGTGESPEGGGG